jgi:CelD/BcsL family acetyltransferase involved in cellulose biosynthesis
LRIVVREEIPEDPELRRSWNELALRMERPEVFYTHEWAVAVHRAYASTLKPLLILAYENDLLVGLVALAWQNTGPLGVAFLTGSTADYCDFLSEPGRRQEVVEAVLAELTKRNISKVVLANLPADSSSVTAISAAASSCRYHLHSREGYLCARVLMGSPEERTALKQATSKKRKLRRCLRDLDKMGKVSVRHDTQWEQIEPMLQSFHRAHVARFLMTGRISNQNRSERRAFLRELSKELCHAGWLTVSRLLIDEIPGAWDFGFQYAGSWFLYQGTVNSNFEDFSPGYCLLAKILEFACDRAEIDVVDLGLGAEEYKYQFATVDRQTLYLVLNESFSGHVRAVVRDTAASVAKASPKIESFLREVISHFAKMKVRLRDTGFAGMLRSAPRRISRSFYSFEEVLFFEWAAGAENSEEACGLKLRKFDSDLLGLAAMTYADDPATLDYLLRCAPRLRSEGDRGFVLLSAEGVPVHFCWAKDFEGFRIPELERTLQAPCPDAVMIFDCFTPASVRGRGLFACAIAALADQLNSEGKVPWIFSAASNQASLQGIKKSGFAYKFTLGRKKFFFHQEVKDSIPSPDPANIASSVSAP